MTDIGRSTYQLAFELSPIILHRGLAELVPGKMLPLIAITQAANFGLALLEGTNPIDDNAWFARFEPLPGSDLIANELGEYPFANQAVAANAIISKPLNLSMLMKLPENQQGAMVSKLITVGALKAALDTHINLGGTFIVATPAFLYTNLILLGLRDVSRSEGRKVQTAFAWDFRKPLLTQEEGEALQGSLMQRLSGGLPTADVTWSSLTNALGF